MAIIFGTETPREVPVTFKIFYESSETDWDSEHLTNIGDVSSSADPINNKRKVSDIEFTLADIDGSIWEGTFANGTGAFEKDISIYAYVGGSMAQESTDIGVDLRLHNESVGNSVLIHQGKIKEISRHGREITVRSETIFRQVKDLKYQPPVRDTAYGWINTGTGSTASLGQANADHIKDVCAYKEEDGTYSFYGIMTEDTIIAASWANTAGIYDTDPSTGVEDFIHSSYSFRKSEFYTKYIPTELKVVGNDIVFPYNNVYTLLHPVQPIKLKGGPTAVLRHLLFGKMVSNYFTEASHKGDSFDSAQAVTAFQVFDQTIDPGQEKVYPDIDNIASVSSALFYVGVSNKFEFEPYGPKDLEDVTEIMGSNEVFEASYSNDIEDYYNNIRLNYGWDSKTEEYTKSFGTTYGDWTIQTNRPYEIDTKWVDNSNQAQTVVHRLLTRFSKTIPHIEVTTSMKFAGVDLGSLYKIEDTDCKLDGMVVQLISYKKGFSNSNTVKGDFLDGTSLWLQRGYGKWEGDETPPDMAGIVGGNGSTCIWGTEIGGVGTAFNINTNKYGTFFSWF